MRDATARKTDTDPAVPTDLASEQSLERVRSFLAGSELGAVTLQQIADALGVHKNTVYNHLEACGTGIAIERQRERERRLEKLLARPGKLRAGDAATELGYAEVGSFFRFFRRVKGESYTDWRRRRQSA